MNDLVNFNDSTGKEREAHKMNKARELRNDVTVSKVTNKEENKMDKEQMKEYLEVTTNILVSEDQENLYLLKKSEDFFAEMFGNDDSYNIVKISKKEDEFGLEINSLKNRLKYAYHYICRNELEQTAGFEVDILKRLGSLDTGILMPGLLGELPERKWLETTTYKVGLNIEPYEEMEEKKQEYLLRYTELFAYLPKADELPVWESVPDNYIYLNAGSHRDYSVLAVQRKGTKRPFLVKVPFGTIEERKYGMEYNRDFSFGEEDDYFFIEEKVFHCHIRGEEWYQDDEYSLNHYLRTTLEGHETSFYLEERTDRIRYQLDKKELVVTMKKTINGNSTFYEGKTHYSDVVMSFFKKLNFLSEELSERVSQFLRDSLSSELKRELEYLPHRPVELSFMTLFHYPNYIWVMDEFVGNSTLNWTDDIKTKPLMKKAEFINLFLPKLGKKGCRRVASQIIISVSENHNEDYSYSRKAFINRHLELNNLLGSKLVIFLPLFNQFVGGLDFLTVEKWMEAQGILSRFSFLCNKVYSSTRVVNREEIEMLEECVSLLLDIYKTDEEYSISHLAKEKDIIGFYNMLSVAFNKVIRGISHSPYDYDEEARDLEEKGSKFSIELPFSPAKIVEMGDKLSICVGEDEYLSKHNNGAYHVLSLKENTTIIGCIEVDNREVLQFKLKHNKLINEDKKQEELSAFIKDWINEKELIISTQDLSNLDGEKEELEDELPF